MSTYVIEMEKKIIVSGFYSLPKVQSGLLHVRVPCLVKVWIMGRYSVKLVVTCLLLGERNISAESYSCTRKVSEVSIDMLWRSYPAQCTMNIP